MAAASEQADRDATNNHHTTGNGSAVTQSVPSEQEGSLSQENIFLFWPNVIVCLHLRCRAPSGSAH